MVATTGQLESWQGQSRGTWEVKGVVCMDWMGPGHRVESRWDLLAEGWWKLREVGPGQMMNSLQG